MAGSRLLLADSRIRAAPPVVTPAVRGGVPDGTRRGGSVGAPPPVRRTSSHGGGSGGLPGEGVWYDRIGAGNFVDLGSKSLGLNIGKSWSGGVLSRLGGVDLPARLTVGGSLAGGRLEAGGESGRGGWVSLGAEGFAEILGDAGGSASGGLWGGIRRLSVCCTGGGGGCEATRRATVAVVAGSGLGRAGGRRDCRALVPSGSGIPAGWRRCGSRV